MGRAEVAVWSLGGTIWDIFETLPSGLGYVAELRVAFHLGNGNPDMAKTAAYKILLYAVVWISFITGLFTYYSHTVVCFFTHDETLIEMLDGLVVLMSIGNIIMCLGSEATYILTAQGRPKITTWIQFCCTLGITLPLSTHFVFQNNYGLQSVLASIIIGSATFTVALLYVVFTSNWEEIGNKILQKSGESVDDEESSDEEFSDEESEELYPGKSLGVLENPLI